MFLLLSAKNPAFIIFGFYHKHAKRRYDDVINLRGCAIVRDDEIVKIVILAAV